MQNSSSKPRTKSPQSRAESLEIFYSAPDDALFNQIVVAHVLDCSQAKLERDRWAGTGVPFIKIGRNARYRKSTVLGAIPRQQVSTSAAPESIAN
ncbi:MAG: hypothetical protein ACXW1Z_19095 [Methylobacter sp.]